MKMTHTTQLIKVDLSSPNRGKINKKHAAIKNIKANIIGTLKGLGASGLMRRNHNKAKIVMRYQFHTTNEYMSAKKLKSPGMRRRQHMIVLNIKALTGVERPERLAIKRGNKTPSDASATIKRELEKVAPLIAPNAEQATSIAKIYAPAEPNAATPTCIPTTSEGL